MTVSRLSKPTLQPLPRLSCLTCAVVAMLSAGSGLVRAQSVGTADSQDSVRLRTSPMLSSPGIAPPGWGGLAPSGAASASAASDNSEPVFLFGESIQGRTDLDTTIQGAAEMRKRSIVIKADRLEYDQAQDKAKGTGHVRLLKNGNLFTGTQLDLKVDAFEGEFLQPHYQFIRNGGEGDAKRVDFLDDKRSVAHDTRFSTCRDPGTVIGWLPDWVLQAGKIHFDFEEQTGFAEDAQLRFKDVPLLSTPALTFPLTEKRKSGLLPPTLNLDNINGLDISLPYYWNIAANRDMTFTPNLQSKRGMNMIGEFRYLEPDYRGDIKANYMPGDKLRDMDRWGLSTRHNQSVVTPLSATPVGLNLNLNRVSDDNYWRDFPRSTNSLTSRLLPSNLGLNWSDGFWQAEFKALRWQTLQDSSAPITSPYAVYPGFNLQYNQRVQGLEFSAEGDLSRFVARESETNQPNTTRSVARFGISAPWLTPGSFVIPSIKWHSAHYVYDSALTNASEFTGLTQVTRSIPTISLDSGLMFDRPIELGGIRMTQTLEPRAFWTWTPYKSQTALPVYDTAAHDFNFGSIWLGNEYVGHDRVSATHTLTLGTTSRLINPDTGAQKLQLTVAQRLRFSDQNAVLPGETPATAKLSDLLLGMGLSWNPHIQLDSTVQFDSQTDRVMRSTWLMRYSPSPYRILNLAYRLNRGASEQFDVGWQWPLDDFWNAKPDSNSSGAGRGLGAGRYYSVGHMSYSMMDRKMLDSVYGIEYDAGCWLARAVVERLLRSDATPNNRIMLQLEFNGFTRLGTNPLDTLRTQIPGYQLLRDRTLTSPDRFTTYE